MMLLLWLLIFFFFFFLPPAFLPPPPPPPLPPPPFPFPFPISPSLLFVSFTQKETPLEDELDNSTKEFVTNDPDVPTLEENGSLTLSERACELKRALERLRQIGSGVTANDQAEETIQRLKEERYEDVHIRPALKTYTITSGIVAYFLDIFPLQCLFSCPKAQFI